MVEKYNTFSDNRGTLVPIEINQIPFTVKRFFIVNDVPVGVTRGGHAHYKTKQYILCIDGTVEVILNDGNSEIIYNLNKSEGVLIPEMIWDSQKFISENSTILVVCSTNYDENDYIHDFEHFIKLKNSQT